MYQYESAARKIEYDDTPKKKAKKSTPSKKTKSAKKKNAEKEAKIAKRNFTIMIMIILGCTLLIVYRNVLINQSFSEVQSLSKEVASLEKENSQILVNIQNSLNLSTIESTATSTLGMQKLSSKQTIYISLDTKDYVEVSTEQTQEEKEGFFENLWNKFLDLF